MFSILAGNDLTNIRFRVPMMTLVECEPFSQSIEFKYPREKHMYPSFDSQQIRNYICNDPINIQNIIRMTLK